ncbi:putative uncharacterized protein DDB_G0270496 isoform X1 [Rhodamnia argentea]|uniref:Uncharacterized protein n=1 Tax=Rhodamnia argentea TaxID=178133 RepID=A0A8B8NZ78_9MYRT|nr:putative uncharacterized protein DDB_G0270496 isoform X1 [Rhodamnia argentea]
MGISSKRARKVRSVSEDGSELEDEELFVDEINSDHGVEEGDSGMDDGGDEEDDEEVSDEDEDASSGDEEEGHGEDGEEQNHGREDEEMKELEKEYMDIWNQEQDILKNLKQHKDEDLLKGQAVQNQKALWDKTLELRFLLQKAFSSSNRLPQEPVRSSFCKSDENVNKAYVDVLMSTKETLGSILELQEALLENNPAIAHSAEGNSAQSIRQLEDYKSNNGHTDDEWSQISQMHRRMAHFRDKSVDKWHRKTQVTTGAAAMKNKLHAFNQNISEQVSTYMRDPSRMVKQMQQRRSTVGIFGSVPEHVDNTNKEEANAEGDSELLDDSEFYQHLLKEFFETIDPTSSEAAFYALRRLQTKKRKVVDRRASKSRKIRYNVHEKIVNFMAPRAMNIPPMAPKLFENLFGLKTQKPGSVA